MTAPEIQTEASATPSSAEAKLYLLPRSSVALLWPRIGPMLARCERRGCGRFDLETVRRRALAGDYLVWCVARAGYAETIDAVAVTEVLHFSSHSVLSCFAFSGRPIARLRTFMQQAREWATAHGIRDVQVTGSAGLARLLPGLREQYRVFLVEDADGR